MKSNELFLKNEHAHTNVIDTLKTVFFLLCTVLILAFLSLKTYQQQNLKEEQQEHIRLLAARQCSSTQKCYAIIQKSFKIRSINDLKRKDYKAVVELLNSL